MPAEVGSHLKNPLFCNRAEFLLIFSAAQAHIKNWPTANFSREPEQLRKSIGTNIRAGKILFLFLEVLEMTKILCITLR